MNGILAEIQDGFSHLKMYCFDEGEVAVDNAIRLDELLKDASTAVPPRPEGSSLSDELMHVYTSGTTGLCLYTSLFLFFKNWNIKVDKCL